MLVCQQAALCPHSHTILTINSNHFLIQHSLIGLSNGNTLCSPENGASTPCSPLPPAPVLNYFNLHLTSGKDKGKIVSVQAKKACRESSSIAPLILTLALEGG